MLACCITSSQIGAVGLGAGPFGVGDGSKGFAASPGVGRWRAARAGHPRLGIPASRASATGQGHGKVGIEAVTCGVVIADDVSGVSAGGGRARAERWKFSTLTIACHEGRPPADDIFAHTGCPQPVPARSPCPGPGPAEEARPPASAGRAARRRDRGGHRGSKSFAAIGQWAADAGPEVLAVLGAARMTPRRSSSAGAPTT